MKIGGLNLGWKMIAGFIALALVKVAATKGWLTPEATSYLDAALTAWTGIAARIAIAKSAPPGAN